MTEDVKLDQTPAAAEQSVQAAPSSPSAIPAEEMSRLTDDIVRRARLLYAR